MAELLFPLQFRRQYAGPLDASATFATTAEMTVYLSDPSRYAGQIATCDETEGAVYVLNSTLDAWIPASGSSLQFTVDEFSYGDVIAPSRTPVGPVLASYNGQLLHSLDDVSSMMEPDDIATLIYLSV